MLRRIACRLGFHKWNHYIFESGEWDECIRCYKKRLWT